MPSITQAFPSARHHHTMKPSFVDSAGYGVQNGALTLDVSNLTSFTVNNSANTVTFGSGLRLGQLYLRMYLEANSLFPAGTCPWVGTAGHILGGPPTYGSEYRSWPCKLLFLGFLLTYVPSVHFSDPLCCICADSQCGNSDCISSAYPVET